MRTTPPPIIIICEKDVHKHCQRLFRKCVKDCLRWGIKIPIKKIVLDEKIRDSKDWYGRTAQTDKGYFIISLSALIFVHYKDEVDEAVRNILFHELAHTCKGAMNHKKPWKSIVRKMNERGAKVNERPYSKKEIPGLY